MTNLWAIVTASGLLIICIGLFLTPAPFAFVYIVGAGMAATGMTVSVLREIDRRRNA